MLRLIACISALIAMPVIAPAQEWKPAPTPLMTRWGNKVTPENAHREYPRPTLVRKDWLNLNGLWQFAAAKEGEAPPFGKDLPERILVPFPVESALSGIGRHEERMWYRTAFAVPPDAAWAGKRILLHLDAADWEATVWINGRQVGAHRGGYDRMTFDITEALAPSGPQELIVGVWDPTDAHWQPRGKQVRKPEGIWYTPTSGIWQTVWLEPVGQARVTGASVETDAGSGGVKVYPRCSPETPAGAEVLVEIYLDGQKVSWASAYWRTDVRVWADMDVTFDRKPWTPQTPTLYEARLALSSFDRAVGKRVVLDEVRTYFALRDISLAPDGSGVPRVVLNGSPAFLLGPLDQGFWPDGLYTPPSDEAMIFDIETTKRLGFNATRKHVKVEPERWYYHCDRLGLLVIQDMPSGDRYIGPRDADIQRTPESAAQFESELGRLLEDRGRHPSIISWVVFNEGWGQSDTARYTNLVRQLDPTRLVISASGWTDRGTGDILDLHTYPGPGPIPSPGEWGGRACILGEFGGLGLAIDGHTWQQKTWGYKGASDRDDLTFQYVELLRRLWDLKTQGLSGGIYTQLTDVEGECNGLLTYDREVMKVDVERAARAARGQFPRVEPVLATSRDAPITWRYTFESPTAGWDAVSFDAGAWKSGAAGFGTRGTPGAVVRTEWNSPEIWIRREFVIDARPHGTPALLIHHDEDAEVYLNGVLAAKVAGYTTDYTIVPVTAEAAAALRPGTNTLAIHCRQTRGGQYIDAGLVQLIERDE